MSAKPSNSKQQFQILSRARDFDQNFDTSVQITPLLLKSAKTLVHTSRLRHLLRHLALLPNLLRRLSRKSRRVTRLLQAVLDGMAAIAALHLPGGQDRHSQVQADQEVDNQHLLGAEEARVSPAREHEQPAIAEEVEETNWREREDLPARVLHRQEPSLRGCENSTVREEERPLVMFALCFIVLIPSSMQDTHLHSQRGGRVAFKEGGSYQSQIWIITTQYRNLFSNTYPLRA